MADETKEGAMPEPQDTGNEQASETPASTDPAEIERIRLALKKANAEAAAYRKKADAFEKAEADRKAAEMTEAEKLAAKLKEYEGKLSQYERAALIRKIADEVGLPASLADRLQGGTEDELKADALKLLELVPQKPKLKTDPTNPGNAERTETPAEKRERLLGGKKNIWEGGGINWQEKG